MLWLSACFVVLSLLAFTAYYFDKQAAIRGTRRTPESTLHALSLLGGWPGALLAQRMFRHKTGKARFQILFWMSVIANVSVFAWISMP
jgi:uncharacterized membrane protein YsdA (DUF1294 family)